jgi:hypothetical protein
MELERERKGLYLAGGGGGAIPNIRINTPATLHTEIYCATPVRLLRR